MPKNMDKFEKLIKDKIEQHEVPFNEAHWNEMDAKLNSLKNVQYIKNIAIAASVVAVVAVSAYFISNNNMDDKNSIVNYSTEVNTNEQAPLIKEETSNTNNTTINTTNNENNIQENHANQTQVIDEKITEQLSEEKTPLLVEDIKQKEIVDNKTPENNNNTVADLNVQAEVLSSTVCLGQQVVFKSKVNAYNPSYLWDFGDGTTSNNAQPHHVYDKAGNYEVTLTVVNNETKQKTVEDVGSVTILPTPTKDFTYTEEALAHDKNKFSYPATTLKTENQNISAYLWKTNDGRTSTEVTPSFVFEDKGTYDVTLMLTHQSGCYVEFTKSVEITLDMDLLAPSGFIPNSSIEENQTFIPKALLGWDVNFKMIITDKSGKLIYETTDKSKPWNGKLNNSGEQLPNDIYLWKVVTYDVSGKAYHHNGTIRLMNK